MAQITQTGPDSGHAFPPPRMYYLTASKRLESFKVSFRNAQARIYHILGGGNEYLFCGSELGNGSVFIVCGPVWIFRKRSLLLTSPCTSAESVSWRQQRAKQCLLASAKGEKVCPGVSKRENSVRWRQQRANECVLVSSNAKNVSWCQPRGK